jgi:hypothetical protein
VLRFWAILLIADVDRTCRNSASSLPSWPECASRPGHQGEQPNAFEEHGLPTGIGSADHQGAPPSLGWHNHATVPYCLDEEGMPRASVIDHHP